ncbi:hypothetical protein MT391_18015 [Vibrio sp. 1-Bac 57]
MTKQENKIFDRDRPTTISIGLFAFILKMNVRDHKYTTEDVYNLLPESIITSYSLAHRRSLTYRMHRKLVKIGGAYEPVKDRRNKKRYKEYRLKQSKITEIIDSTDHPKTLKIELEKSKLLSERKEISKDRNRKKDEFDRCDKKLSEINEKIVALYSQIKNNFIFN